jgi:hypothetical protein
VEVSDLFSTSALAAWLVLIYHMFPDLLSPIARELADRLGHYVDRGKLFYRHRYHDQSTKWFELRSATEAEVQFFTCLTAELTLVHDTLERDVQVTDSHRAEAELQLGFRFRESGEYEYVQVLHGGKWEDEYPYRSPMQLERCLLQAIAYRLAVQAKLNSLQLTGRDLARLS